VISGNYGFDRLQRCVVLRGGTIKCWGFGRRIPVTVHGIRNAVSVSVGDDRASYCALLRGGKISCGLDYLDHRRGQAGYEEPGITNARTISSGEAHTCVALFGGMVKCWGSNSSGQLGNGRRNSYGPTVTVKGIRNATAVSAGDNDFVSQGDGFTCALLRSGKIKCWGDNSSGQLGNPAFSSAARSLTPVQVSGIANATQVSAGNGHACALLSDGTVKCWGDDRIGQLGDGGKTVNPTPVDVIGLS
jgi:alpha-tubulin suppressor-like RCC1 family protein